VPDFIAAADLRYRASLACEAQEWTACLAKLDEAREIDPVGDGTSAVRTLRDRANAGLEDKPPKPLP